MASETDSTIIIGIQLDDGTIKQATIQADQLAEKLGSTIGGGVSGGIDKSFTGIAVQLQFVAQLASKAFDAIAGIVGSAVDEAIQAEQAITKFNFALANTGHFTQQASDDFAAFAASLQKVGTVSDDAVVEAASSLVSIGNLSGEALKRATQASVDLSAGLGVELGGAFDLVAKAATGNTAALGRYGIKVDENVPKSERFAAVLDQINSKFAGLDAGKAETFGGAIAKFQLSFGDVLETLGGIITQSPVLIAVIKGASGLLGSLGDRIKSFAGQGDVFRPIIGFLLAMADAITKYVLPVFELLYNAAKFVFNAILTGLGTLASAFNGVALAAGTALNALGAISDETLQTLQTNFDLSTQATVGFAESTAVAFEQITTDFSMTAAVDGVLLDFQRLVDEAPAVLGKLALPVKTATDGITNQFALTAKTLADIVNKSIVNVISQGVQVIVTNLAKGRDAFGGLLRAIAGIFGDMLIQIGTTVLLAGIGMEALRASIVGLTGGPAIFAGIALIAAGALLKALSGGGGGEAPTTTQPVGPGGVPSSPDVPGGQPEQDRDRDRKTEVNINVSGNILDRKETGLEIASVLQEYFDTSSGVLSKA